MCVALFVNIKGITYRSPKFVNVGCGKCEECRAVYKSGWAFRLSAQFSPLIDKGWKMCFYTLTYDNRNLPTLPASVYKDPLHDFYTDVGPLVKTRYGLRHDSYKSFCDSRGIPCFSRDDVSDFVHHMRDWFRSRGLLDVQFFITSEFGDSTNRPHYHGIYCVPPDFDTRALFKRIERYWSKGYYYIQGRKIKYHRPKGFLFPRYYQGGKDENGYTHKPFVVDSPNGAMRYIAKYVTKDLAYIDYLSSLDIPLSQFHTKSRVWRRCMPFHVQTKSLGKAFVDGLSDDECLRILESGRAFLGDKKRRAVPRYIKDKILFIPYYRKKGNKRQVLRMPTPFLQEHYNEVFRIKTKQQKENYERHLNYDVFKKECSDDSEHFRQYTSIVRHINGLNVDPYAWKVAYFGQDLSRCFVPFLSEPSVYWLERLKPFSTFQPYRLNRRELSLFEDLRDCFCALDWLKSRKLRSRSLAQKEIDATRDFWKSRHYLSLVS